jgi:hypothetical protein
MTYYWSEQFDAQPDLDGDLFLAWRESMWSLVAIPRHGLWARLKAMLRW